MRGLRGLRFGGQLAHGYVLLEQLLVLFRFPPSLVNRGQSGLVQVDAAADQIQNALAVVLVCKDLSAYEYRFFHGP